MISEKEILSFKKNGYLIKKSNDIKSLDEIQSFVYKILSRKKKYPKR